MYVSFLIGSNLSFGIGSLVDKKEAKGKKVNAKVMIFLRI